MLLFFSYNNTRREVISFFKKAKNLDITSFQAIRILFAYIFLYKFSCFKFNCLLCLWWIDFRSALLDDKFGQLKIQKKERPCETRKAGNLLRRPQVALSSHLNAFTLQCYGITRNGFSITDIQKWYHFFWLC